MAKYLVTGGAGFIGSNIVAALCSRGDEVVICDTLGQGERWKNISKRVLADFVLPYQLPAFLETAEPLTAVIHMGAISATTETDGDLIIQTNFQLSKRFWEYCSQYRIPYIYASSAATYGDGAGGFNDDESPEALANLRPLNLYGWSKHLFDQWAIRHVAMGLPAPPQWVGLKFFNVYGPNEYHKGSMQSVVAHLYPKVVSGQPARLFKSYHQDYPDGGQLRDFVYVADCVSVILWLCKNPRISGLFNVGTGQARSFADLAIATMKSLNLEPRIEFVDMPETLRGKYQYYTQANLDKLRGAGYTQPMTSLEDGVRDYVQRFLNNPVDSFN